MFQYLYKRCGMWMLHRGNCFVITVTMGTTPQYKSNCSKLLSLFRLRSSKMEGLEKLRPFIWFCQLCGFFPYRMEVDPVTKRFKRFTFSICHPVTFWYFFVNLAPFVPISIYSSSEKIKEDAVEMTPLQYCLIATQCIDLFVIWIFVYRLPLINKAVQLLQDVDESLKSISDRSFSITHRIYIGVAYTLISVITIYGYWLPRWSVFIVSSFDDRRRHISLHYISIDKAEKK